MQICFFAWRIFKCATRNQNDSKMQNNEIAQFRAISNKYQTHNQNNKKHSENEPGRILPGFNKIIK